jgi:hypothetical protein
MPEADLRVYVVWLPVLSSMSPEALAGGARSGAKRMPDARVRHYLDAEARLGTHYTRALALPMEDPAWDVFLVFDSKVRWEKAPPRPDTWMHQLGAGPRAQHLDAKKLAETLRGLLPAKPAGGL